MNRIANRLFLTLLLSAIGLFQPVMGQGEASSEAGSGALQPASSSYEISPLDVVRVTLYVADEVQFNTEARVSQQGFISLPYLNNVDVAGSTVDQVRELIYEPYNRDYYVEPHLDIVVLSYSVRSVTVIGKVNRQGPVPFPAEEKMHLLEAIAHSGGWSNDRLADVRSVTITRTGDDGEKDVIQIDARNITARDHPLKDGDLINVPERMW